MRVIAASIDIDADAERVWEIVRDTTRYGEWSPFLAGVEGDVVVGKPVVLVVRMKMSPTARPVRQTETVTKIAPGGPDAPSEIGWGIQGFFLETERIQRVVPMGPGRSRYETTDSFEGLVVPIVMAFFGKHIQAGFEATARALKARAEAR